MLLSGAGLILQLVLWQVSARDRLAGSAWTALLREVLLAQPELELDCVAIEPGLYRSTPAARLEEIQLVLRHRRIDLRIEEPTHHPPTGYFDRECLEIFHESHEGLAETVNLPIVSRAVISSYRYDFNGDAVLMLQIGPSWVKLTSWSLWI